jgi:SWI/SNF-related matrix-associated actin-dependent regulator 1 of chromatin subfamily A
MLRMQQLTAGLIQGEEDAHVLPTGKMAALSEYLDELCPTHKVIVWCNWKTPLQQIKKLCDKLGLYYTSIEGGQTTQERQEQVDLFNMEAKYSVCIANQQAGGVGIGLQSASYMIYFSKGYSLEQNIQSEARAYRGGSEIHKSITRIDLITRGTIDEDIHAALEDKVEMAELIQRIKEKYGKTK